MCLAVPVRTRATYADGSATVDPGSVERHINLLITPEVQIRDRVLVHTGFAIGVLDANEAEETLCSLEELVTCAAEETPDEIY